MIVEVPVDFRVERGVVLQEPEVVFRNGMTEELISVPPGVGFRVTGVIGWQVGVVTELNGPCDEPSYVQGGVRQFTIRSRRPSNLEYCPLTS